MNDTLKQEEFSEQENIGITGLVQAIWKARFYMVYAVLVTMAFLLVIFFCLLVFIPSEKTFQSAVNFTFLSQKKDNTQQNEKKEQDIFFYPNGLRFSLNDLTSPLVMEKVYEDNKLAEKGITKRDFITAVRISPYAPAYKSIVDRYRARLADRKLTFEERKVIEDNMARELRDKSQSNGLIQLYYASRLGIDPLLGKKLVLDIPKIWSEISIKQRGVLKIGQEVGNKPLINKNILETYDYPVILDIVSQAIVLFKKQLQEFIKLDGAESITDPATGHTINTLMQDFNKIELYEIPMVTSFLNNAAIYKNPDLSKTYIQERIFEETQKKQAILDRMNAISNILNENRQGKGQDRVGAAGRAVSGKGEVVPQITEGFFDQMVEMIKKSSNADLYEKLVVEKLALQKKLNPVKSVLSTLKRRMNVLNQHIENRKNHSVKIKDFTDRINVISDRLNDYRNVLKSLFHQLGIKRYSYDSHLYRSLALEKTVISYHPVMSGKVLAISLIALILSAIIGLFMGLIRQRT